MALLKPLLVKSTYVPASFHRVVTVTLNDGPKNTAVSVASYYSKEAFAAGAMPVAQSNYIIPSLPNRSEDAWDFAETALTAPAPDGAEVSDEIVQFAAQNQYVFAGAEIV